MLKFAHSCRLDVQEGGAVSQQIIDAGEQLSTEKLARYKDALATCLFKLAHERGPGD